jgi:hypothetical protein
VLPVEVDALLHRSRSAAVIGGAASWVERLRGRGVEARSVRAPAELGAEDHFDLAIVAGAFSDLDARAPANFDEAAAQLARAADLVLVMRDAFDGDALPAIVAALSRHHLVRDDRSGAGALVLSRSDAGAASVIADYERRIAGLEREAAARRLAAIEYRDALQERERAIDSLRGVDDNTLQPLFEELLSIRARFAPPDSFRTRALDWLLRGLRVPAAAAAHGLDARDALYKNLRALRGRGPDAP